MRSMRFAVDMYIHEHSFCKSMRPLGWSLHFKSFAMTRATIRSIEIAERGCSASPCKQAALD
jgi:hypothetical protein